MEKKSLISRLKFPTKPSGHVFWIKGLKSIILVGLAVLIAQLTGLGEGTKIIMLITLNATIMIDLPLPFRKILPLALFGFLLTLFAFLCSFLTISSLPAFLLFTVIFAFFSSSMFIFSENAGSFGFITFMNYLFSVIFINPTTTINQWLLYVVISFSVASLLLVLKFFQRKSDVLGMIASIFLPETQLESVLSTRQALSGIPLNLRDYNLLKLGTYLTRYRTYTKLLLSYSTSQSQEPYYNQSKEPNYPQFQGSNNQSLESYDDFMNVLDKNSAKIADRIKGVKVGIDLKSMDIELGKITEKTHFPDSKVSESIQNVLNKLRSLIIKSDELLKTEYPSKIKKTIHSPRFYLRNVFISNFNLENMYIRHTLRFVLALTLGLVAVYLSPNHDRDLIWITMGILIIMKPDITSTMDNLLSRAFFNFLAIIVALILGLVFPHDILLILAFFMLFFFRSFFPSYMGLSLMAMSIFVVLTWPGLLWENALARLIDLTLGGIIAFFCAYLIFPGKITSSIPHQIALTIRANQKYAENVLSTLTLENQPELVVKSFRRYLLQEKNLDSLLRKIEDTFQDVEKDLSLFQELLSINRKLSADLNEIESLLQSGDTSKDLDAYCEVITRALGEISLSVEKDVILPPVAVDGIKIDFKNKDFKNKDILARDLEHYLKWIINDLYYLQLDVDLAIREGAFKRYNRLY